MITLPDDTPLSRGPLRAFWLSVCLPASGLSYVAVRGLAGHRSAVAAAGGLLGLGAAGVARPYLAYRPYRRWAAVSARAARDLTTYTAWVTQVTAVAPVDAGDDVTAGRWTSAASGSHKPPPRPREQGLQPMVEGHPLRETSRWLAAGEVPRRRWLVASLAVLRWLQPPARDEDRQPLPHDTYTLF